MPDDNTVIEGGKILAGAVFFIIILTMISAISPQSYPMGDQNEGDAETTYIEKAWSFITSSPYNFCIGGILVILSLVASYYSKKTAVVGEFLRTLGPLQGYIFGFGAMLILIPFM